MSTSTTPTNALGVACSFCDKDSEHVKKLIAGPGVYICDECISLCNAILDEEAKHGESTERRPPSLDNAPVDQLLSIFGAMARTARSMEDRLGVWARKLAERGASAEAVAHEAGITEAEATTRFGLTTKR